MAGHWGVWERSVDAGTLTTGVVEHIPGIAATVVLALIPGKSLDGHIHERGDHPVEECPVAGALARRLRSEDAAIRRRVLRAAHAADIMAGLLMLEVCPLLDQRATP